MEKEPKPKGEPKLEIERKFLIQTKPSNLDQYPHQNIRQGYLEISENGTEVRVRQKGNQYFKTKKSGRGEVREEEEIEISQEDFNELWPETEGKRIEKVRYSIPHGELTIELDIYQGQLGGLITAEVEFNSQEECDQFAPPEWFGQDVTSNLGYKNQSLAIKGLPEE